MSRPKARQMTAANPRSIMTAEANAMHGVPVQRADVLEGCTQGARKPSSKRVERNRGVRSKTLAARQVQPHSRLPGPMWEMKRAPRGGETPILTHTYGLDRLADARISSSVRSGSFATRSSNHCKALLQVSLWSASAALSLATS
jgi:hypothetical protein